MNPDRNALFWAFPAGTWFATRVRVSIFFPLIVAAVCIRLGDLAVGAAFGTLLFASVVLHEFGHVLGARRTGGWADEIVVTPFGGLAACFPAHSFHSRFWTVAGGPAVNVVLCLLTLLPVANSQHAAACLAPFEFPAVALQGVSGVVAVETLFLLLFKANWLLLLINLLPVYPLDGGRMLALLLGRRFDPVLARTRYLQVGAVTGIILLVVGLATDNTWIMAVGAIILPLNLAEAHQMAVDEPSEESFMGYDFSQGYTSLERSVDEDEPRPARPGLLERWRSQREADRRQREAERDQQMQDQLDALLEKLHIHGESGLTPAERRQLQDISVRLRNRGRQSQG